MVVDLFLLYKHSTQIDEMSDVFFSKLATNLIDCGTVTHGKKQMLQQFE